MEHRSFQDFPRPVEEYFPFPVVATVRIFMGNTPRGSFNIFLLAFAVFWWSFQELGYPATFIAGCYHLATMLVCCLSPRRIGWVVAIRIRFGLLHVRDAIGHCVLPTGALLEIDTDLPPLEF